MKVRKNMREYYWQCSFKSASKWKGNIWSMLRIIMSARVKEFPRKCFIVVVVGEELQINCPRAYDCKLDL